MKYYVSKETGSVYFMEKGKVIFTPLNDDGTFDTHSYMEVNDKKNTRKGKPVRVKDNDIAFDDFINNTVKPLIKRS
jgi:hypothetical protein